MRIVEQVTFEDARFTEYDGTRMIRDVALLGGTSKKGYKYAQEAMRKAVPLYNGARVFIGHPTAEEERSGRRDVMKLAGRIETARFDGGKVKGDLRLLDDEHGRKFWNISKMMPDVASCSHVADGKLETVGGEKVVTEIAAVESVDLVIHGATTSTVFEDVHNMPAQTLSDHLYGSSEDATVLSAYNQAFGPGDLGRPEQPVVEDGRHTVVTARGTTIEFL